nr:ABC transporter ATP-binding protein [Microlunatus kandeliicorticis]
MTVRFGDRTALDDLSLTAARGAITALLGPNGAGKTTFLRCCTGLIRPSAGRVRVLGHPAGSPAATVGIGSMPQSTGAWSGIRPLELLRHLAGLYAHPLPVDALAARLGIDDFARTPYRRLSGGEKQAVNLAGALVGRPELVFLDEPTAGMDPHARRATWALLGELREAGVSLLLTTHAMDEAATLADRVHIVDGGRVRLSGTVAELTGDGRSLEDVFLASTSPHAVSPSGAER